MMRNRRQITCRCDAYRFPHRFGGGLCNGIQIVQLSHGGIMCANCISNNNGCEVLKGLESPSECHYVIDFIEYNEV